ncbi:MAG: retroviral-like aspartic protease family protein [Sandaracinaceae bacterium]|nr:retroviral-like aspartic protease family protein [Sandaracinaceae bacterium]
MRIAFCTIALSLIACGPSSQSATIQARQPMMSVPLVYSTTPIASAAGRVLPLALVEVEIAGIRTRAIVDTGATLSVIDDRIARRAALVISQIDFTTTNPAGGQASARGTSGAHMRIVGLGTEVMDAVLVDLPEALVSSGVGAILSPQQLIQNSDELVEIDIPNAQLRHHLRGADVVHGGSICIRMEDGFETRTLISQGQVADQPVVLELDTGASTSMLVESSGAAPGLMLHPLASEGERIGVGGAMAARIYEGVPLEYLGLAMNATVGLTAGEIGDACGRDGRVGLREISHCVVRIAAATFDLVCADPAG